MIGIIKVEGNMIFGDVYLVVNFLLLLEKGFDGLCEKVVECCLCINLMVLEDLYGE